MPGKMTEGQMDFFELLNEYKDSQGATVRVRDPEQVMFDRFEESVDSIEDLKAAENAKKQANLDRVNETERLRAESIKRIEAEFKKAEAAEADKEEEAKRRAEEEAKRRAEEEAKRKTEEEAKRKAEEEAKRRAEEEAKRRAEEEAKRKAEEEAKRKAEEEKTKTVIVKEEEAPKKEQLFKQCKRCWCFTCKHNSRNEAVPREMCGTKMACPACKGCIDEDIATICEIGNAKEGCMTRAIEEGIYVPEEI